MGHGRWSDFPYRRDYFGIAGGRKLDSHGWRGDVFRDGMFGINLAHKLTDVSDGLSNTLFIGEQAPAGACLLRGRGRRTQPPAPLL
jgi:hypothetical protein